MHGYFYAGNKHRDVRSLRTIYPQQNSGQTCDIISNAIIIEMLLWVGYHFHLGVS
ncbi:hypothetical protein BC826DRAFT_1051995 [Russula brevipes]|nr:hypothetical protein BC826DRAFT_1051995 [Russula brevipes]